MTAFNAGVEDALTKFAATMGEIRAASRRIGHEITEGIRGGLTVPTKRQYKAMVGTPEGKAFLRQQGRIGHPNMTPSKVREAIKHPEVKKRMGEIHMAPDNFFDLSAGRRKDKNLRAFMNVHEGFERKAKPRPGAAHISPEVIMNEHNLLSRLRGRGSGGVKESVGKFRKTELDVLKKQMRRRFRDPRAAKYIERGEKIPKAMRKAMLKKRQHVSKPKIRQIADEQTRAQLESI